MPVKLFLALPRWAKRFVAICADVVLCILTVWFAYYLRLGEFIGLVENDYWLQGIVRATLASVVISVPIFIGLRFYYVIFRHGVEIATVVRGLVVYGAVYATIFTLIGVEGVPRTIGIIQPILLLLSLRLLRIIVNQGLNDSYKNIRGGGKQAKVLIYGAGEAGRQLASAIGADLHMKMLGFIDDNPSFRGNKIAGYRVYSSSDLNKIVSTLCVTHVLLAMPSIGLKRRNEIVNLIKPLHVSVRTLPSVSDLANGKVSVSDIRDLDVMDLLGRDAVDPDVALLVKNIEGRVILVTGAGGSIGGELCRQILAANPTVLLLVEQSEPALYLIHQELEKRVAGREIVLVPLLASIQNETRLSQIISTWRPHALYHAAAYKHVPIVEYNQSEGIANNVFGTLHLANLAFKYGVSDFVLVSTDKAVRPTNMMGASKRLAEIILQSLAACKPQTKFCMVRFGNVLGSSGSVVPKFREQIEGGGPVTVTHPEITRYFMTIPEAAQLVIQAAALARSGDVCVLDMGEPVKILGLARRMIELSGLTVKENGCSEGDIEIQIIGLRPGEKLYEELLIGNNPQSTPHPKIMVATEELIPWADLEVGLKALACALDKNDVKSIRSLMKTLVSGFEPSDEIVDCTYLASS